LLAEEPLVLHELRAHEFGLARPLFQEFDYSLSIFAAVESGWSNAERTRQKEEFRILYDDPEWDILIERMALNAKE
jgi:hypothetical protein